MPEELLMAQAHAGLCGPQRLHTLQTIFDLIWIEMRANGGINYTSQNDPDALRDEIASRVFSQYSGDDSYAE